MNKSIMGFPMDECAVCASPYVQIHHIMYGSANRKLADHYGLTIPLCQEHHTGQQGVHFNKEMDINLKKLAQEKFDKVYGDKYTFFEVFGKNYL